MGAGPGFYAGLTRVATDRVKGHDLAVRADQERRGAISSVGLRPTLDGVGDGDVYGDSPGITHDGVGERANVGGVLDGTTSGDRADLPAVQLGACRGCDFDEVAGVVGVCDF